jgi:hypothetical protein
VLNPLFTFYIKSQRLRTYMLTCIFLYNRNGNSETMVLVLPGTIKHCKKTGIETSQQYTNIQMLCNTSSQQEDENKDHR